MACYKFHLFNSKFNLYFKQTATNKAIETELHDKYPNISQSYFVCSDTIGSVFTASPLGGMVLIAGTGSNALLRNPDGATYQCGGWGSFIADESSGRFARHFLYYVPS